MASQYYDSENISESKLSFKMATAEPHSHRRNDGVCTRVLYGLDRYVSHVEASLT